MLTVIGNKTLEVSKEELTSIIKKYKHVHIDLGTGDGRFIYKSALQQKETFFIGVDPSRKQLEVYSKKTLRQKVKNAMFVVASFEELPYELNNLAGSATVILPWGSLLSAVVEADTAFLENFRQLLRDNAQVSLVFGYSPESEPSEVARLKLDKLDFDYIKNYLLPEFKKQGFNQQKVEILKKEQLKDFESSWSKKLVFGQNRPLFLLEFKYNPATL